MSRVGSVPILIPDSVIVLVDGREVLVKGPLGELQLQFCPEVKVAVEEGSDLPAGRQVVVKRKKEDKVSKSLHGLTRSLIANMVSGVEKGWEKKLELIGVGFRAQTSGDRLSLQVGFSHPVEIAASPGIKFAVADNTKITVSGIDKNLVGQVAASVRQVRPPEPYQGKGIRYAGEYVRRKAGKAGKVGAGAK